MGCGRESSYWYNLNVSVSLATCRDVGLFPASEIIFRRIGGKVTDCMFNAVSESLRFLYLTNNCD